MALEIVEKDSGGITILSISGRITLGEASQQLRTKLKDVLREGKSRLVLDLSDVGYIDSAGLGTLVSGYTSAYNQNAIMKLAHLSNKFHDLLSITKLLTVFDVYDTVDDALNSFVPVH